MEDKLMDKKYYWIIDGNYYEVSKETYQKLKKEHDHSKRLEKYENEAVILSLDALVTEDHNGYDFVADPDVNVEDEAIQNVMIGKLRAILKSLSGKELELIHMLYELNKSEREIAEKLDISQNAVHKQKKKLLAKLKKFLES